ncbi:MAG: LacI family transcriptional regulator, partial [Actinobacteria bacterium]|nr:LacI family transcriptional regulator [Actinomycetota bacterium]
MKNEQINLKYISDEFGVSTSTISRAIHNLPGVSKELQERILRRINELQFRTNIIARSLKTGKFNVLGVIVPDNSQIYFARIIKGIEDTAKKRDYSVIVMNTDRDIKNEVKCISILNALSVAGILAAPIDESNYLNTSISVMILSKRGNNYTNKDFDYVINDDFKGAYIATEHLIKKGYNLIFFLGPKQKFLTSKKRLAGYKKALKDYNIAFNENMVINIDGLSFEDGYNAIKKINKFPGQLFSFFC